MVVLRFYLRLKKMKKGKLDESSLLGIANYPQKNYLQKWRLLPGDFGDFGRKDRNTDLRFWKKI